MHRPDPEVYTVRASASMNDWFVPPLHQFKAMPEPSVDISCACRHMPHLTVTGGYKVGGPMRCLELMLS